MDFRVALRGLRRHRAFTATAILTLALGIGAATAVFSVVYGMLWRPLDVANAERFVQIVQTIRVNGGPAHAGLSLNQMIEWSAQASRVSDVGRYSQSPATLTDAGPAVRLNGIRMTPALFRALAGRPRAGRFFTDEDAASTEPVVVLSARAWTRYFGHAADIVDRTIVLDDVPHRVIGITQPGFEAGMVPLTAAAAPLRTADGQIADTPDLWRPLPRPVASLSAGGVSLFPVFAMLKPGVTMQEAGDEARRVVPPLRPGSPRGDRLALDLTSPRAEMGRRASRALTLFAGVVAALLLIGCLNAVNLLLSRYAARRREMAVRSSLGAARLQLARAVISEAIVLALAGGVTGVLLAYWLVALVRTAPRDVLPGVQDVHVDGLVLAFAVAVSMATGLVVGIAAAVRSIRGNLLAELATGAVTIARGGRATPSRALVVAQIGAATVLIAIAGLLLDSFVRARGVPAGFDPANVLSFRLTLPSRDDVGSGISRTPREPGTYSDLARALRSIPGVDAVSATNGTMDGVAITWSAMTIDGRPQPGEPELFNRRVAPGFFRLLRVPLRGREFSDADVGPSARVAVVNDAFARRFFPAIDPVGHRLTFNNWDLEIVGVVGDARDTSREFDVAVPPVLYLPPDAEYDLSPLVVLLRTSAAQPPTLAAIRAAINRVDPRLAMYDTVSLEEVLAQRVATPQMYSLISSITAALSLALAAIGLYGLLNFLVAARTRELGVRMALGADRRRVIAMIVRDAAALVAGGAIAGLAGAVYAATLLKNLLYGVQPGDPKTLALTVVLLAGVGLLATVIPARRATRVDPVVALRTE